MRKHFFIFTFVLLSGMIFGQNYSSICISNEERELLNLINDYRVENGLPSLDISAALTYTADMHTADLFYNKPHIKGKSLYSWSNKGKWNKLNFKKSKKPIKEIKDKPSEITRYNGQSLEAIYYSSGVFSPRLIFERWKQQPDINNMMLNRQEYSTSMWKVIGVSHFEGYTSVWFGPLDDTTGTVSFCEGEPAVLANTKSKEENKLVEVSKEVKYSEIYSNNNNNKVEEEEMKEEVTEQIHTQPQVEQTTGDIWYVVVGSASDMNSANRMLNVFKQQGLNNAEILTKDGKFRIIAGKFNNRPAADNFKSTVVNQYGYRDAWILKN